METIVTSLLVLQLQVASIQLAALPITAEAAIVTQLPEAGLFPSRENLDLETYAASVAKEHGLNVNRFLSVIKCESQWNPNAEGDYEKGVPTSFGLAQFHYPERFWGITPEEAKNPEIALPLMAKAWANGEHRKWSCWRILYG